MKMNYRCPKHEFTLKPVEDYPGALVCPIGARLCPEIYTVIEGHLCILDGLQWKDTNDSAQY